MTEPFGVKPELARRVVRDADEVSSRIEDVASGIAQVGGERGDVVTHGDAEDFRKQVDSVAGAVEDAGKWLKQHADQLRGHVGKFEATDHLA